jgi:hypothetical protein
VEQPSKVKEACRYFFIEAAVALAFSYLINLAIVSTFAEFFFEEKCAVDSYACMPVSSFDENAHQGQVCGDMTGDFKCGEIVRGGLGGVGGGGGVRSGGMSGGGGMGGRASSSELGHSLRWSFPVPQNDRTDQAVLFGFLGSYERERTSASGRVQADECERTSARADERERTTRADERRAPARGA